MKKGDFNYTFFYKLAIYFRLQGILKPFVLVDQTVTYFFKPESDPQSVSNKLCIFTTRRNCFLWIYLTPYVTWDKKRQKSAQKNEQEKKPTWKKQTCQQHQLHLSRNIAPRIDHAFIVHISTLNTHLPDSLLCPLYRMLYLYITHLFY